MIERPEGKTSVRNQICKNTLHLMAEEPDLNPEDVEILDRNIRNRIEEKKQRRAHKKSIPSPTRFWPPCGQTECKWKEIRAMFDSSHSDEQIRHALLTLMKTPLATNKIEKALEHIGERFLLAG